MKQIFTSFLAILLVSGMANAQDKKACLKFDGANDKVVIPHDAALNLGRSAFTIEAYITASPNMTSNMVLAPMILSKKGASSPSTDGMLFGLSDQGKLALQIEGASFTPGFGGGGGGTPALDLRDGACHHIAWTREVYGGMADDTVNGYQDGAYVRKTRLAAQQKDISNAQDLWIGGSGFNTNPNIYWFEGQIKEIRIWDYARTETQIWTDKDKHLTGSESGLLFYWRLNENGTSARFGDTIYDCGPSGLNGVIDGAMWENFWCDKMDAIPSPNNCVPDTTTTPPPPNGITENSSDVDISVYPNPFTNELNIIADHTLTVDKVRIYDVTGRLSLEQKWTGSGLINVASLKEGTYFIQLWSDDRLIHRSLITKE